MVNCLCQQLPSVCLFIDSSRPFLATSMNTKLRPQNTVCKCGTPNLLQSCLRILVGKGLFGLSSQRTLRGEETSSNRIGQCMCIYTHIVIKNINTYIQKKSSNNFKDAFCPSLHNPVDAFSDEQVPASEQPFGPRPKAS